MDEDTSTVGLRLRLSIGDGDDTSQAGGGEGGRAHVDSRSAMVEYVGKWMVMSTSEKRMWEGDGGWGERGREKVEVVFVLTRKARRLPDDGGIKQPNTNGRSRAGSCRTDAKTQNGYHTRSEAPIERREGSR